MPTDPTPAPTPDDVEQRMREIRGAASAYKGHWIRSDVVWLLDQLAAARAVLQQIAEAQPAQWHDNLHNDVDCDGCDRLIGVARDFLAGKDVT